MKMGRGPGQVVRKEKMRPRERLEILAAAEGDLFWRFRRVSTCAKFS
jgi:hypothetical protein